MLGKPILQEKNSERKKEIQPFDPTPQRAYNLGNQSASYLLLLYQETGLQREKKKHKTQKTKNTGKSTVAISVLEGSAYVSWNSKLKF